MRGIELPYRVDHEFGRRSKGLDEALRQVRMGSRADSIVLVSDMNGIQDASDGDLQELARARAGRRKIVSLVPYGPNFSEVVFSKPGQIIAEILEQEEDAKLSRMRSMLTKKGIPMLVLGPGDGVSSVSQRISRSGSGRRRVA
ncbi:MAG: hypothetical protein COB09_03910 [Thalassobium sp.]|nr:MAG: hypothetical protein COB09_03910 [Thalassobium sp.]